MLMTPTTGEDLPITGSDDGSFKILLTHSMDHEDKMGVDGRWWAEVGLFKVASTQAGSNYQ